MPRNDDRHSDNSVGNHKLAVRFGNVILEEGFTVLPNILLRHQATLKLTSPEFNFIAQIWYHWWSEKDAYPALTTVSKRMGVKDVGTLRRISKSLQKKGYLLVKDRVSPVRGQLSSEYDFSPLINLLEELYLKEKGSAGVGEVDWVTTIREITPPLANLHGGGLAKMPGAPLAKMPP